MPRLVGFDRNFSTGVCRFIQFVRDISTFRGMSIYPVCEGHFYF